MPLIGLLILFAGAYLVNSAVKDRRPLASLAEALRSGDVNAVRSAGAKFDPFPNVKFGSIEGTGLTSRQSGGSTYDQQVPTAGGAQVQGAIAFALAQVGKPYRWGATGPDRYDCSGLMQAAYKSVGVNLPRNSAAQAKGGTKVTRETLQPGDVIRPNVGHVYMYLGGGQIVEAPRTGLNVRVAPMRGFLDGSRYV